MTLKSKGFSKKNRLTKPAEFKKAKLHGDAVSSRYFVLCISENELGFPRLGLVVSSVIKKSVDRNRIKRLLREHFRKNLEKYPKADVVFIAKQRAEKVTKNDISEDIESILKKVI